MAKKSLQTPPRERARPDGAEGRGRRGEDMPAGYNMLII
jgi:hypothetical protein